MYLNLVMLLNFLVDFSLLAGTNRLAGYPSDYRCIAASALLGAVYSGACLLRRFRFLGGIHWRVVFFLIMAGIAFGWNPGTIKRCGLFLILSFALGGAAEVLGKGGIPGLLLSAAAMMVLLIAAVGETAGGREFLPLEIVSGNKRLNLVALRDTGHSLRDPISGEPVLIIGCIQACELTGLTHRQLSAPLETIASRALPGLRLIPYRTIGQKQSLMLAMRFENVRINGKQKPTVVAFAPEGLGETMYQALAGGSM